MNYILVFCISLYQLLISPFIHAITGSTSGCRYQPTCSEYAKQVIARNGVKKGIVLALRRFSTCHPFAKAR